MFPPNQIISLAFVQFSCVIINALILGSVLIWLLIFRVSIVLGDSFDFILHDLPIHEFLVTLIQTNSVYLKSISLGREVFDLSY